MEARPGIFKKTPLKLTLLKNIPLVYPKLLIKTPSLDGNEIPPIPKHPFNIKIADGKDSARKKIHAITTQKKVRSVDANE